MKAHPRDGKTTARCCFVRGICLTSATLARRASAVAHQANPGAMNGSAKTEIALGQEISHAQETSCAPETYRVQGI